MCPSTQRRVVQLQDTLGRVCGIRRVGGLQLLASRRVFGGTQSHTRRISTTALVIYPAIKRFYRNPENAGVCDVLFRCLLRDRRQEGRVCIKLLYVKEVVPQKIIRLTQTILEELSIGLLITLC